MSDKQSSNSEFEIKGQVIRDFTPESKGIKISFRVLSIGALREVKSTKTGKFHRVQEVVIADSSAKMTMTLWDSDIDMIEIGKTYTLKGGFIRLFNESMYLNRETRGVIAREDDLDIQIKSSVDMSIPFSWQDSPKKKRRIELGRTLQGGLGRERKGFCASKGF